MTDQRNTTVNNNYYFHKNYYYYIYIINISMLSKELSVINFIKPIIVL